MRFSYRAKDEEGVWHKGYLIVLGTEYRLITSSTIPNNHNEYKDLMVSTIRINPETLCLRLDFKDANDFNLYDKDFVLYYDESSNLYLIFMTISDGDGIRLLFRQSYTSEGIPIKYTGYLHSSINLDQITVIGNLFDTPIFNIKQEENQDLYSKFNSDYEDSDYEDSNDLDCEDEYE